MKTAEMLAKHRETWDMPTLMEQEPEILQHLDSRYEIHFGMMSEVIVVHKAERRTEGFATTDVREVVATLLEREVERQEVSL